MQLDAAQFSDDRAVAHGRLERVFRALGEEILAQLHGVKAKEEWAAHRAVQSQLLSLVGGWKVP